MNFNSVSDIKYVPNPVLKAKRKANFIIFWIILVNKMSIYVYKLYNYLEFISLHCHQKNEINIFSLISLFRYQA